jgi:hypothetical protein
MTGAYDTALEKLTIYKNNIHMDQKIYITERL